MLKQKTCWMLVWQVADGDFYSIDLHHDNTVLWIHVYVTVEKQQKYMNYYIVFWISSLRVLNFFDNVDINTVCSYMSAIFTLIWFCSSVWSLFSRTMNLSSGVQS